MPKYRVEVKHEGLKKHRVITGNDHTAVQRKAQLQVETWNGMWVKQVERERLKAERQAKAQAATKQTEAAQAALAELESILAHALAIDQEIDWEALKDHSEWTKPKPVQPAIPPEPQESDQRYQARFGLLDRVSSSRRQQKLAEARDLFDREYRDWEKERDETIRTHEAELSLWQRDRDEFLTIQRDLSAEVDDLHTRYLRREPPAVVEYAETVLRRSKYPSLFPHTFDLDYNVETKTLIVEYQLPSCDAMPKAKEFKYVATRDSFTEVPLSESHVNRLYDNTLYQTVLRSIYELFQSDEADALDAVVFNGWVRFVDRATGQEADACILSLHATKDEFAGLNLARVDPKDCFRSLRGLGSPKLHTLTPVAPIMQIDREDRRFVAAYDVLEGLQEGDNLAAIDWEDFEHLIREVFEKEFTEAGGEVKVTRASRDGGVDAVAFDPDPIRGGKIVIQAKRYTATVGVAAVRDLYGTVVNEGATKGILVTTSDFGPDAFAFAKGKPLTLLNGANLLHLLSKHGYQARIDLEEARRAAKESDTM